MDASYSWSLSFSFEGGLAHLLSITGGFSPPSPPGSAALDSYITHTLPPVASHVIAAIDEHGSVLYLEERVNFEVY